MNIIRPDHTRFVTRSRSHSHTTQYFHHIGYSVSHYAELTAMAHCADTYARCYNMETVMTHLEIYNAL